MKGIIGPLIKIYNNKWIKYFAIPVILLIFWFASSLVFTNFTTLTQKYSIETITHMPVGKLLKDESITGEFTASEDNLGILAVHFANYEKVNNYYQDFLEFKIKEKDAKIWQYQNIYKSNAISGMPLYPFGFPKFTNSKGKMFIFSLTSLKGNEENALQLSKDEPILVSKYVFTKSDLFANKKNIVQYSIKKLINSFTDFGYIKSSLTFGIPFFLYLIWLIISPKLHGKFYHSLFIMPIFIFIMISLNIDIINGVFLGFIAIWILIIFILKKESSYSFALALLFFIFALVAALVNDQNLVGRLSNWTYAFLVIGAVQLLLELKLSEKENDFK